MYSVKQIKDKLLERMVDFSSHPVTQNNQTKALVRYIGFNILGRFKKELTYNWLPPLRFYASIGDAGMSGNIYFGLSELPESLFTIFLLRRNECFIDIGANLGHYSLLASGISKAYSIAIEPIPSTFQKLERQVELNHLGTKIKLINVGLAENDGMLFFSKHMGTMNRVVQEGGPNTISVAVNTLDQIAHEENPVLIKIDVEGFEKFVLEGAQQSLTKTSLKAMIIELNGSGQAFGISDEEVFKMITRYGFLPYKYHVGSRRLLPLKTYNRDQYNTIFIRDLNYCKARISSAPDIRIWGESF